MRRIRVIGIGTGNPDHLTFEALHALEQTQVVFVPDKGIEKAGLLDLRRRICARIDAESAPRFVAIPDPARERLPVDYNATVEGWHQARADLYEQAIGAHLTEGRSGAFLVWGDPSLYDSTLRILDRIVEGGRLALDYDVLPGISSVQLLAARHRIALNRIGAPVQTSGGR